LFNICVFYSHNSFKHRQFHDWENRSEGLYNVGVVYFKNSEKGKEVSDWWSDAVINRKYPQLSTCGDQKYLEYFIKICPPNNIYVDGDIGHGAPWQWQLYDYSLYKIYGKIIWNGVSQLLIFSHFSQFFYDLDNNRYIPSTRHHIYTPSSSYIDIPELKLIYDNYFEGIKLIHSKYLYT